MMNNELMHYGVLGMKWGIHRAAKRGETYTYKSHGQKKYEKKINKLESKGKDTTNAQRKLDTYKMRDSARENFARKTSVGATVARGILLGPIGSGTYNRMRSAGHGAARSAITAFVGKSLLVSAPFAGITYAHERREFKRTQQHRERSKSIGN